MDIGCNIPDAALLRNLAEDLPDMAPSIRHRLRELADLIEARDANSRPEIPALHEGMREVPCAVRDDGWLHIPHADGQWVTAAKLQPFSLAIIEHWRKEKDHG